MIGNGNWFERRKYGGWGLTPKTWQGWAYIAAFIAIVSGVQYLPMFTVDTKMYLTYGLTAIICLDIVHMMCTVKKDELETKMEAIAERNAAWTMVLITAVAIVVQAIQSAISNRLAIDWYLFAIIFAGAIVKSVTNYWLERKGI
jgi:hypothetical protein